jgi:hypothetical protein
MNALDLFCGSGGWTRGFLAEGFSVTGVDLERHPAYPLGAGFIKADLQETPILLEFPRGAPLVIVASPPCEEFSRMSMPWTRARNPPEPSLALVERTREIVRAVQPRFWVLENVKGAVPYLGLPVKRVGSRYLWGDFPPFYCKPKHGKARLGPSEGRYHKRSEIPFELARSLARACAGVPT